MTSRKPTRLSKRPHDASQGIQFRRDERGQASTTRTGKAILNAAFAAGQAGRFASAQQALTDEKHWRKHYPRHLRALSAAAAVEPVFALTSAQAAIDEAWRQFVYARGEQQSDLEVAMQMPRHRLVSMELRGRGDPAVKPWVLPYKGEHLQGQAIRDVLARWEADGIAEPGHVQAINRVLDNPQWFDLSDQYLVLLGAGSEAGPLGWLAQWRANVVAVDLPGSTTWKRIASHFKAGNGRLIAPVAPEHHNRSDWIRHAGANLLTDAPEIAAWLCNMSPTLDIASLAYLDGEQHLRVAMAMDAISHTVATAKRNTGRMFMATPTDIFVVPRDTALAAMRKYAQRTKLVKSAGAPLRLISGGRWLLPHIESLTHSADGQHYGLVDALVVEQGPNYALAKRLQQWRAVVTRAQHARVSFNVAPSTSTRSVIKNPALKAGFEGANHFGIEVFEPETTNALMAALWVHDLRCSESIANPQVALTHPLEQLTHTANHGGLWRSGYLPRSAMPLAAMMGFLSPPKK